MNLKTDVKYLTDKKRSTLTNFIHNLDHFLDFIRADVWTVCETKVDENPLAKEVFAFARLVVVVNQGERSTEERFS